jgi:TonB family protein
LLVVGQAADYQIAENTIQGGVLKIQSVTMMSIFRKLAPVVLFACAPVWSQSGSAPPNPAPQQTPQVAQTLPDSGKTDQTSPVPPPDSTHLIAIKTENAKYPWEAHREKLQGQVWVQIHVSETGDVDAAEVASGDPTLAKSAVEAAKKWKFRPFIRGGKPVQVSTKLPFNFAFSEDVLDEKAQPDEARTEPAASAANAAVPTQGDASLSGSAVPQRVKVSQGVSAGLLVHKVQPLYPPDARRLGIQGSVLLRATISKEGQVKDVQLVSGSKELAPAAIGAVQQWRYRPYLLLGNPVEVNTMIKVDFQLQ